MIKNFTEWQKLNEERISSNLSEYFEEAWADIKFPWEEKIEEALETAKETLEEFNLYNLNKRRGQGAVSNDTVSFNIKYYDGPDMSKLKARFGENFDEDHIFELFREYLDEQLEAFVDGLDYNWISDIFQDGRSGGWLVIQFTAGSSPEQIKSDIIYDLEIYVDNVDWVEPTTKEELHKLRGTRMGKKFGLNESDEPKSRSERAEELNYAERESNSLVESINTHIESAKTILVDLEEIETLIEKGMKGLKDGFEEYLDDLESR